MKKLFFSAVLIQAILWNCTWTPRSILPTYFRTIYIPKAENSTLEPDIEILLTNKLKTEFELDSRLKVTEHVSLANGILYVEIIKYKKVPVTYTVSGEIDTTTLIMAVEIKLRDIKSGQILIEGEIEESLDFNLKSEPVETEIEVRDKLIDKLARRIVSKSIEGW